MNALLATADDEKQESEVGGLVRVESDNLAAVHHVVHSDRRVARQREQVAEDLRVVR